MGLGTWGLLQSVPSQPWRQHGQGRNPKSSTLASQGDHFLATRPWGLENEVETLKIKP